MVSSLLLRSVFGGVFLVGRVAAQQTYQLDTAYSGATFFEEWDFFDGVDPTVGFVTYNDANSASDKDLISVDSSGTAFISVDAKNTISSNGPGRDSVRISTKKQFTHGLIIADITNMPGGVCGTWPAFWSFGPNWPTSGEIDIIEGVNSQSKNLMSLHVSGECTVAGDIQVGTLQTSNCDQSAGFGSGCGVLDTTTLSYGQGFNANNGGVYATQWTSDFIRIWFFPSGSIPADITSGNPDPTSWGTPTTNFQGSCTIDDHFKNHNIIFDTTFCGQWGGAVWASDPVCGSLAPTCNEYVANNPGAFTDMYWAIRSVKVYQLGDAPAPPAPPTSIPEPIPTIAPEPSTTTSLSSSTEVANTSTDVTLSTSSTELPTISESATSIIPLPTPTGQPIIKQIVGAYTFHSCLTESAADAVGIRTLASKTTAYDTMTLESCAVDCAGFTYFGTEYGRECYCGDEFTSGSVSAADGECGMVCAGDGTELCGGSNRVSVYGLTADIGISSSSTEFPVPISDALGASSTTSSETSSTTDLPTTTSSSLQSSTTEQTTTSGAVFVQLPSSTSSSSSLESQTSSSILPSPTESTSPNPANIGAFTYLGCYAPPSTSFTKIYEGDDTTPELCVSKCSTSAYAGVFGSECYCGNSLDGAELQIVGSCNLPCPGDSSLVCGGQITAVPKRSFGQGVLLTVYECPENIPATSNLSTSSSSPISSKLSAIGIKNSTSTSSQIIFKPTISISPETTSYEVSTVYTTRVHTVTSCAATVTDCPVRVTTEIISLYTTLCPVTANPSPTPTPAPLPTSNAGGQSTVSTVYTTKIYTVTSCAETVTDCPAQIGHVTTEIISLYTTLCPFSTTHQPSLTSQTPQGSVYGVGNGGSATSSYALPTSVESTVINEQPTVTNVGVPNISVVGSAEGVKTSLITVVPVATPLYPVSQSSVGSGAQGTGAAAGSATSTGGAAVPSYSGMLTSKAERIGGWSFIAKLILGGGVFVLL